MRFLIASFVLFLIIVLSQSNTESKLYLEGDNYFKCRRRMLDECQVPTIDNKFEMCPYSYKIQAKCYQETLKKCPTLTNKEQGIIFNPCRNPRINMYHGDKYNKIIDNGYILY